MNKPNIVIVGGGLAGLTTAYLLEQKGYQSTILEARNRLGGRILTCRYDDEPPLEMGATWLGKKHTHLINLLEQLDIGIFEQFMGNKAYYEPISTSPPQLVQLPENEDPTYRIEGGSDNLIQTLKQKLNNCSVELGQAVTSIQQNDRAVQIETTQSRFNADIVILTLPPKLLHDHISFSPALPSSLTDIAAQTHTWMADSIKIALSYRKPFWREENTSGTIMSNAGPITELYDHSNQEGSRFALKGFMNEAYHSLSKKERRELTLDHLQKFYGNKINKYLSYHETIWREEPYTFANYQQHIIPHQHNGEPIFQQWYWDHSLLIAGSETAQAFPGYMDGAVESARTVAKKITDRF